jgi:hypothetical protein
MRMLQNKRAFDRYINISMLGVFLVEFIGLIKAV